MVTFSVLAASAVAVGATHITSPASAPGSGEATPAKTTFTESTSARTTDAEAPAPSTDADATSRPSAEAAAGTFIPSKRKIIANGPVDRYLLDGEWLFRTDPLDAGIAERWYVPPPDGESLDPALWAAVEVPHVWNARDESAQSMAGGVGWYYKKFSLPSSGLRAAGWSLIFQGISYRGQVWLNGKQIGGHTSSWTSFEADARRAVKPGDNHLLVRVDSRRRKLDVPALGDDGWFNWSGMSREVYLRRQGVLTIDTVRVTPKVDCRGTRCGRAAINVDVQLRNLGGGRRGQLRGSVSGPGGFRAGVRFRKKSVKGGKSASVSGSVTVPSPKLWQPGQPNLYKVNITSGSGSDAETHTIETGLRSIKKTRRGDILLNGRKLRARGASMHEDHPIRASALTENDRKEDVGLLKSINATITRSHYPLHPQTYELLDRAGILAYVEVPVWGTSELTLQHREFKLRAFDMMAENIRQNGNHPSIIIWSVGNEVSPDESFAKTSYLENAAMRARDLDSSRLIAYTMHGYPYFHPQKAYRKFDLLGVNDYYGWYKGYNNSSADRNSLLPYLEKMDKLYPEQAKMVTENGAEASRHGDVTQKGTYEFQTEYLKWHHDRVMERPAYSAYIIWILREFRARVAWCGGDPSGICDAWHNKAIFDMWGDPKPAVETVRDMFSRGGWYR